MAEERRKIKINKEQAQDPSPAPENEGETGEPEITVREECEDLLTQKDEEIKQLQDRVLRLAAETENTRKRLEREKSEGICFANESMIRELLPVLDNLERALQHAETESTPQSLLEGVRMTLKGFSTALARFGCSSFESEGKPFDPHYHEAVMQEESQEYPENTVIKELQKGYILNDRLLRPAMVVVSKAPKE